MTVSFYFCAVLHTNFLCTLTQIHVPRAQVGHLKLCGTEMEWLVTHLELDDLKKFCAFIFVDHLVAFICPFDGWDTNILLCKLKWKCLFSSLMYLMLCKFLFYLQTFIIHPSIYYMAIDFKCGFDGNSAGNWMYHTHKWQINGIENKNGNRIVDDGVSGIVLIADAKLIKYLLAKIVRNVCTLYIVKTRLAVTQSTDVAVLCAWCGYSHTIIIWTNAFRNYKTQTETLTANWCTHSIYILHLHLHGTYIWSSQQRT